MNDHNINLCSKQRQQLHEELNYQMPNNCIRGSQRLPVSDKQNKEILTLTASSKEHK